MLKRNVTALFCVNDLIASVIIQTAQNKNISIPEDISIVGFDNIQFEDILNTHLTSVAQDFDLIAKESVELLVKRIKNINDNGQKNIIVPTELYKGNTVKSL